MAAVCRRHPAGHMFYSRDASCRAFRGDTLALYRAAMQRE
jgi:hypothetical protein